MTDTIAFPLADVSPVSPSASSPVALSPDAIAPERPRFMSEADCHELLHRLTQVSRGGGSAGVMIWSTWTGNVRWARNQITTSGEVRNDWIRPHRSLGGAVNPWMLLNDSSDAGLVAAARRAERLARLWPENPQIALYDRFVPEPTTQPAQLFFDATYNLDAEQRAVTAQQLAQRATAAGMLSAGYIEVAAHSMAVLDTAGHTQYVQYTTAEYSVTVRDPSGTGSGWAGVDWPDWRRIDGAALTATALDKCLTSRNPVTIEPGRYTTILEPQAVGDLVSPMVRGNALDWTHAASGNSNSSNYDSPFGTRTWKMHLHEQVIDPRLTIGADPTDPDLAFPTFNPWDANNFQAGFILAYAQYHPVTWIKHGVLTQLAYDRNIARDMLEQNIGVPNAGACRISVTGPTHSIDEMIASTTRGLLVTRFSGVSVLDLQSQLQRGYTRDGLWLIEHGKIAKPVKNLVFTESVTAALNNIDQIGVPQRVFAANAEMLRAIPQPMIVPALKIKDFSFTALTGAV